MKLEGVVKVFAIGDSIGITIPKEIREFLNINEGTFLKVTVNGKKVVLEVVK